MDENSRENTERDCWPGGKGGKVEGFEPFYDDRGSIHNLTEFPCGSVAVIVSRAGTTRSNHYHKTDAHYLFCLSGSFVYRECDIGEEVKDARPIRVNAGVTVYTPPMRVHRCEFIEHTVLISCSKLTRTHQVHEADVVRVP